MDTNQVIASLFGVPRALVGMIHVEALPGTPRARLEMPEICDLAAQEAQSLQSAGFQGLMIENMHDRPYLKRTVGPEIVAAMAVVGRVVRQVANLPLGLQILGGANRDAVAAAHACGAAFVRVEGFVFAHVADEGLMESDAGELLRYRRAIGANSIRVFADIKKKHASHAVTADVDLAETARAAEFFNADAVVVTGTHTGSAAEPDDVSTVIEAVTIPTLVGSGITPENITQFASANAFIVGSYLKSDGVWSNPLDPDRVENLVTAFSKLADT